MSSRPSCIKASHLICRFPTHTKKPSSTEPLHNIRGELPSTNTLQPSQVLVLLNAGGSTESDNLYNTPRTCSPFPHVDSGIYAGSLQRRYRKS